MITYTINFKVHNGPNDNSPLMDAAFVPQMSDETNTYAIKRRDNNVVIIAAHTPSIPQEMTRLSLGTYRYQFDGSEDLQYIYAIRYQVGTGPIQYMEGVKGALTGTEPPPPETPVNLYVTYAEFERYWGKKNITEASNRDSKSTDPNYGVIQDAFDYASDELHDTLRGGVYGVPLSFASYNNRVPRTVKDCIHTLSFGYLYDIRGWDDRQKVGNKLTARIERQYRWMWAVRNGLRMIEAAGASTTAGNAVTQEVTPFFPRRLYPYGRVLVMAW